ncbi:MAG: DUF4886 domain-containing protein [Paludibacteraceae bacterium]
MKRRFFILLTAILMGANLSLSATTIRVLTIGNSFSEDAVENYLYDLGKEKGITFIIGNMYIGSSSLQLHWNNAQNNSADYSYRKIDASGIKTTTANATLQQAIADEAWDYISFQQNSGNSGILSTYFPYLTDLLAYVQTQATNPNVNYILHQTWAYAENSTHSEFSKYGNSQLTMYNAIVVAISQAAAQAGISIVVPSGTAIQNGRSSMLGDTFCRDGYHLNLGMGRFTAACTWYEKLTGLSVLDNAYIPSSVTSTEAEIVKKAAHYAILTPGAVTSLAAEYPPAAPLAHPVNIDFGAVTGSSTAWNYFTSYTQGSKLFNLTDITGTSTGIIIEVDEAFSGVNSAGASTTNTTLNMPSYVSNDAFWSQGTVKPQSGFTLSNLDKTAQYRFTFFSSRYYSTGTPDNRETLFIVTGTNGGKDSLNAYNNTSNIVTINNITPTLDGKISIKIKPGSHNNNDLKYFYINSLQIDNYTDISTDVDDLDSRATTDVFPNPFSSNFHIKTSEEIKKASISNLLGGELIRFSENDIQNNHYSANQLPKGTYLLKVTDKNGRNLLTPIIKK